MLCCLYRYIPHGMYPLPRPDGLSTVDVLQLLRRSSEDVHVVTSIPRGVKNNVYCVLDHGTNYDRHVKGQNSVYDDDCGVWASSKNRSAIYPYVVDDDGDMTRVFWIASQNAYCHERKVDGKRIYVPLDPQPAGDTVVCVKRYYVTLAANASYKCRITLLTDMSAAHADQRNVVVVEYFGAHVTGAPHGNTRVPDTAAPYVRTACATLDKVCALNEKMAPT